MSAPAPERPRPVLIGEAARQRRYARWQRACIALDRRLNQLIVPVVVLLFIWVIVPSIIAVAQGRHP